jgi:hypothetical protein
LESILLNITTQLKAYHFFFIQYAFEITDENIVHFYRAEICIGMCHMEMVGDSCGIYIHGDLIAVLLSAAKTSTSNCSMTSKTSLRPSMNELTATRSMRFVVAWYSTRSTCALSSGSVDEAETMEKCLWTRGDSSGSTWRALRAVEASRGVGKGICRCL